MRELLFLFLSFLTFKITGQEVIPIDTSHWEIQAQAFIIENYKGKNAIYIQNGAITLKDTTFKNGTIEFDVYLTERQSFPGVYFRQTDDYNCETFFLRPHLPGKPDANQGSPIVNGIQAFQLYFGEAYSATYDYNYSDWTHVKVVVNDFKAQAYLDWSSEPLLSWNLVHTPQEGLISFGTSFAPMHFADIIINKHQSEIINFETRTTYHPDPQIISKWQISEKFEEHQLQDISALDELIQSQEFNKSLNIVENIAVDISQLHNRYDSQKPGNTVFAKVNIISDRKQTKVFDFGYSDRVVVFLNGNPIYKGNNKWRSRDYRYLGTIGFFDSVYLQLKEGPNELLLAVSEDFGGWLVTGKFKDSNNILIQTQ